MGGGFVDGAYKPRNEDIDLVNDELVFAGGGKVPVYANKEYIRIGCHRLSRRAYEALKRMIEGKK